MGFNSVAVILNDGIGYAARDPKFGERVSSAVRGYSYKDREPFANSASAVEVHENGYVGSFGGVLTVISQAHADYYQVVVVGGNTGWSLSDEDIPQSAIDAAVRGLEARGYRVSKKLRQKQSGA